MREFRNEAAGVHRRLQISERERLRDKRVGRLPRVGGFQRDSVQVSSGVSPRRVELQRAVRGQLPQLLAGRW